MKRLLAATVATTVGLVTAVGMTSSAAQAQSGTPSYTPPPISWGTCTNATLKARGAQCGFVVVPLDYAHPGGTKIKIAVSRVLHKSAAADYQGVMLVNPGGPGGSGLIYSVLQPAIPNNVGLDYDWIGFDPRGVGSSVPSLACDGNVAGYNRPYYVPVTKQLEKTWLARSKAYAQAWKDAGVGPADSVKPETLRADVRSFVVERVLEESGPDVPIAYLGDDTTDEDAFRVLRGLGLGVRVHPRWSATMADAWLQPPHGVVEFLKRWGAARFPVQET